MNSSASLKCLFLHNYYQNTGGEDLSMAAEIKLLRQAGHTVKLLKWHNNDIPHMSIREKLVLPLQTTWNPTSKHRVHNALIDLKADLLHAQNLFPLASPSVYSAAQRLNVPVVQHLRNFRMSCLNSYLYRKGKVCENCIGRNPWRGVLRRCYRSSFPASASVWQMLIFHRSRKTWKNHVDAFITPSQFSAQKLIESGLPENKLHVKPNFIEDPLSDGMIKPLPKRPTFLFSGRLSAEKGVMVLLKAWKLVDNKDWKLMIVGSGPEKLKLQLFCEEYGLDNVDFVGQMSLDQLILKIQQSTLSIVPSQWYETFGRVVIEAFSCGRPVIASNLGALAELVEEGVSGFLISPSNEYAWADSIQWCGENLSAVSRMGKAARKLYLEKFTPEINYQKMFDIYSKVIEG